MLTLAPLRSLFQRQWSSLARTEFLSSFACCWRYPGDPGPLNTLTLTHPTTRVVVLGTDLPVSPLPEPVVPGLNQELV